jgi:cytochrome P450
MTLSVIGPLPVSLESADVQRSLSENLAPSQVAWNMLAGRAEVEAVFGDDSGIISPDGSGRLCSAASSGYFAASGATTGATAMSMQSAASPAIAFTPPKRNSLTHIPGDEGWPIVGQTLSVLADPKGHVEKHSAKYGLVYRSHLFGETSLVLLGPEANELVLFDQAKLFSSTLGWGRILGLLFPRGLMLLDFDEHRLHRRALSVAFKSGPMKSYLAELDTGIAARVRQWKSQPGSMLFYPAMKQLTLDLAATSFLGAGIGPEVDEITRAFVDMVAASVAVIRRPLPGTKMARGVRGRKRIVAYFSEQIPIRRARGGEDLFSQLCHATHEDGALLSTQDIVDHMSFLMMAAHDTLTSSLTSFIGALAAHPQWQGKLREEVMALGVAAEQPTTFDNLEAMPLTEMAFKEALRLKPPVLSMPRRAIRDLSFKGFAIPGGTMVGINPLFTHHMPEIWPEPERFDPLRFTEEASRNRHRFAWVPFGGGAHMCLGLHFAYMQAKCFARHFLQNLEVSLEEGYTPDWQMWPIPKPRDGLRVTLKPV